MYDRNILVEQTDPELWKAIVAEKEADRLYLAVSRLKDVHSEYSGDKPLYPSLLVAADVNNVERAA